MLHMILDPKRLRCTVIAYRLIDNEIEGTEDSKKYANMQDFLFVSFPI